MLGEPDSVGDVTDSDCVVRWGWCEGAVVTDE